MVILIVLYLLRMVMTYFVLRKVYIKKPHMVGEIDILFCSIPFVGGFILITLLPFAFDSSTKRQVLDFIFFVKK